MVLSLPALTQIAAGLEQGGVRAQCAAFSSTHDAGLAVFLWMHALPLQRGLGAALTGLEKLKRDGVPPNKFAVHRVK